MEELLVYVTILPSPLTPSCGQTAVVSTQEGEIIFSIVKWAGHKLSGEVVHLSRTPSWEEAPCRCFLLTFDVQR